MENTELEFFKKHLTEMLNNLSHKGSDALENLSENIEALADPTDRAAAESDRAFMLRLHDRDRKLAIKVKEALLRIEDGCFGECEECGEEIGIPRLKARPVTTFCIKCKSKQEETESIQGKQ